MPDKWQNQNMSSKTYNLYENLIPDFKTKINRKNLNVKNILETNWNTMGEVPLLSLALLHFHLKKYKIRIDFP